VCFISSYLIQDAKLQAGYEQYGNSWKKVAEYVGEGVTNIQCQKRWTRNANPEMQGRSEDPWTEAEVGITSVIVVILLNMHVIADGAAEGFSGVAPHRRGVGQRQGWCD
jgi:hypothetical protein